MANNLLLASDNFASGSLAAGWGTFGGYSKTKVVSGSPNVTEPNATSTNAGQIWTGLIWPNDQICELTLGTLTNESLTFIDIGVRLQTGASLSGYLALIGNSQVIIAKYVAGVQSNLTTVAATWATGDVFSFAAIGACLTVYQNGSPLARAVDTVFASGYPGYLQYTSVNVTHTQVQAFRGYSVQQQDGIWKKQGVAIVPISSDSVKGVSVGSRVIYEGNAQILSGNVYKMWFWEGLSGVGYVESSDGVSWTRYASNVLASYGFPNIIEVAGTYYMYAQPTAGIGASAIAAFTSPDGIAWTLQNATAIPAAAGQYSFVPVYVDSNGTWYGLGSKNVGANDLQVNLYTSSDGIDWSAYSGNPVAKNFWTATPVLVNGVWYMWTAGNQQGQGGSNWFDPSDTVRVSSPDLITWSTETLSIHHAEMNEGVNSSAGQAYANAVIDIGGKAHMYYDAVYGDGAGPWQISLAIAPASIASIISQPEDGAQQIATDAFTSGAGDLSANWTLSTGGTKLKIVAGPYVEPTTTSTVCSAVYTGATFGSSQYSEITLHALTGTLDQSIIAPTVWASTTAQTWYEAQIGSPTATSDAAAAIYNRVAGTPTQIGPTATLTPSVGDVFRLSVVAGSDGFPVLSLFQNGFLILQVQDYSAAISSGNPGMWASSSVAIGDAQISSWAGGNANVIPTYPAGGFLPPFGAGSTGTLGEAASPSAASNRTSEFGTGRTEIIG